MSDTTYDTGDGDWTGDAAQSPVPEQADNEILVETVDLTGDGVLDTILTEVAADGTSTTFIDVTADARPDVIAVDMTGDGLPDVVVSVVADGFLFEYDADGDGRPDSQVTYSREQLAEQFPETLALFEQQFAGLQPVDGSVADTTVDGTTDSAAEPVTPVEGADSGLVVGDPDDASEHWFEQARNGNCVPASVAQIVAEYTGEHFDNERAFVYLADAIDAWADDTKTGITLDGAHRMLVAAGVPVSDPMAGSPGALIAYLEQGHRVLLAVDSGEYWYGEDVEDDAADHAVVVTGIDLERGVAILSDPGHPDGDQMEVDLTVFVDAWADSGYGMIVCDVTADDFTPAASLEPVGTPADSGTGTPADTFAAATTPEPDVAGAAQPGAEPGAAPAGLTGEELIARMRELPFEAPEPHGFAAVGDFVQRNPWVMLAVALPAAAIVRSKA